MNKSIKTIFTLVICLSLVGCGGNKVKNYPISSSSSYMDEAILIPEEIFTSVSVNDLIGSVFYFDGEVTDSDNIEGMNYVNVKNENGNVLVVDMYNKLRDTVDSKAYKLFIEEEEADYTLPDIGENVHVIATYAGYSETLKKPILYLGANTFIVENHR